MAYATSEEFASFSGLTAPADINRLLERASEVIDANTRTAVYDVDENGDPTDENDIEAFMKATCAQVEHWMSGDEEDDILGPLQSISVGGMNVQMGAAQYRTAPMELAPRAVRILTNAGLYSADPVSL